MSAIKIILLGDSGVGKSKICHRYTNKDGYFNDASTIGVDFKFINYTHENSNYRIHIWDTAGQEKFRSIVNTYFRDNHACIIVFDINNYHSLHGVNSWIEQVNSNNDTENNIFLLGNKTDLINNQLLSVSDQDIQSFREKNPSIVGYYEVSAENGVNLNYAMNDIISTTININKKKLQNINSKAVLTTDKTPNTRLIVNEEEKCIKGKCF